MAPRKKTEAASAASDAAPDIKLDLSGQVTLPLDGQEFVLRPSFEAIVAIERELRPLFDLAQDATRGTLTLDEMGVIACEMMKAHGRAKPDDELATTYRAASPERLGKLIFEAGSPRICARIMVVLVGALNGGYTSEGEAKAPAKRDE